MAVHQGNGPPPVLAYNANSDRGWNDPPTMAFAATHGVSTPKKRIDPRKRVAHDCISGSGLNTGMANLSLGVNQPPNNIHGQQNTYHHSQTQPNVSTPPLIGTFAPPTMNSATSQPPVISQAHGYYTPASHGHLSMPRYGSTPTPPVTGSMTPPIYAVNQNAHHMHHASSMPNLQHPFAEDASFMSQNRQGSHTPLSNIKSPFQTFSTVGEPSTAMSTSTDSTHVGQPLFYPSSQTSQPAIQNPVSNVHNYQRTIAVTSISHTPPSVLNSEQHLINKTMPSLPVSDSGETPHHVRSNSVPDVVPFSNGVRTPPASIGPPPTEGYYTRSLSPYSSRQKTPSPILKNGGTQNGKLQASKEPENHHNVMDQLYFALDKCSATIEAKAHDDVKKKLDILENQWHSNSLSKNVKDRLVTLASAISNGNYEEAFSIHQSLMVDYSNEVSQWMIGIKKLIAASRT